MTEDWLSDYLKLCVETITKYGHMVQYVGADQRGGEEQTGGDQPLAYTIGLADTLGYELALNGLDPETSRNVLNSAAHVLKEGKTTPEDGLLVEGVLVGYVIRLRRVTGGLDDFVTLRKLYPDTDTVWQVEYPDNKGNFPDDPEYDLLDGTQHQL